MSISSSPKGATGPIGPTGPIGATGASGSAGAGGWTTLSKPSDQTVSNSSTLVDDNDLLFTMAVNTTYRIRGVIYCDPTAAGDWKYAFIGPATPTRIRFVSLATAAQATPAFATPTVGAAYPAASITAANSDRSFIKFDAIVVNVNSGTFKFQFAQDTPVADAGAVVRAGSWMEYSTA